uniref:Uncharacterized protein n=1 Tax=Anguilla anguilla TaxID=7936 RepID=A0A0E9U6J7_ANGAN
MIKSMVMPSYIHHSENTLAI